MFCEKCGKELADGTVFCENCGAKTNVANNDVNAESIVNDYGSDFTPPASGVKNNKRKKIIAASVAGAVVVCGAVTGIAFRNQIGNWFNKLTKNEEEYLEHVVSKNAEDILKNNAGLSGLSNALDILSSDNWNASVEIKAEAGDAAYELLENLGAEDIENIDWLENGSMYFDITRDKNKFGVGAKANINSTDVVTADIAYDTDSEYLYLSCPEVFSKAIRTQVPMDDIADSSELENLPDIDILKSLPDEKVISELLVKYVKCALQSDVDVEEESDKLSVEGISQKATKMTLTITEENLEEMAYAIVKEAKNDKDIEDIIKSFAELYGYDGDEVYEEFTEGINSLLNEKRSSSELSSEELAEIYVWADNQGDIIGFGFEADGVEVTYQALSQGDKFAIECKMTVDGEEISYVGSGTEKKNKIEGKFFLKYNDMDIIEFAMSDIDNKKLEEGVFNGKISIQLSSQASSLLNMVDLDSDVIDIVKDMKLELQSDGNTFDITAYKNNDKLIKISLSTQLSKGGNVDIPNDYIDVDSDAIDEKFMQIFEPDAFLDNLRNANVPSEFIDGLEENMNSDASYYEYY